MPSPSCHEDVTTQIGNLAEIGQTRSADASSHHLIRCYDATVRTTVTLDSDTEQLVRRRMRERGQTFKEALNDLIRGSGAEEGRSEGFRTQVARMGESTVNLDRALQIAAELEDDELIRKMRTGS